MAALLSHPATGSAQEEDDSLGLSIEAAYSSLYYFRGDNLFKKDRLMDQNGLASLSVSYAIGPLTLIYWGGFQTNGDNFSENIDVGLGAEQDLAVTYTRELPADLSLEMGVLSYLYPFADEKAAETSFPAFIDPFVALAWTGIIDARMCVWWYLGIPEALAEQRYVYFNPSVGREFDLAPDWKLEAEIVGGYKIYTLYAGENDETPRDNLWDVLLKVGVSWAFRENHYVTPSISAGWTNLAERGFGDEYMVFAGVAVGWER